jgi:putative flippase GtrA
VSGSRRIACAYVAIATVASSTNILLQFLFVRFVDVPYAVELSVAFATALVLPFKYVADKKIIFKYRVDHVRKDLRTLIAYTLVSVVTVAVFWSTEFAFHYLFASEVLRYVGGIIGLAVSFYVKYRMDKKFVFT